MRYFIDVNKVAFQFLSFNFFASLRQNQRGLTPTEMQCDNGKRMMKNKLLLVLTIFSVCSAAYAVEDEVKTVDFDGVKTHRANYTKDAWGTDYVYNSAASPPTLISRGSDRVAGGTGLAADITLEIPNEQITATVQGVIWNNGVPWSGTAVVEINEPDGTGLLTQATTSMVPGDNGGFTLSSVPLGIRSITVYEPVKGAGNLHTSGPFIFPVDRNNTAVTIQASGL